MKKTAETEKKTSHKGKSLSPGYSESDNLQQRRMSLMKAKDSEDVAFSARNQSVRESDDIKLKPPYGNSTSGHVSNLNERRKQAFESSSNVLSTPAGLERLIPDFIHEVSSPINVFDHALDNLKTDFAKFTDQLTQLNVSGQIFERLVSHLQSIEINLYLPAQPHLQERERRKVLAAWLKNFKFKRYQQGADIFAACGLSSEDTVLNEVFSKENGENNFEFILSFLYIKQSLRALESAKGRATGLVKSLKNYKDISSGAMPENFILNDTITEAITILGHRLRARKFNLQLSDPFILFGIPQHITHVWINLLANAIEATDERGHIQLSVQSKNGEIVVSVKDDGKGIPSYNLEKIFQPYFTTKGDKGGTGIGLDICKNYLNNMNADINVNSVPGTTEFSVHFRI